MCLQVLLKSSKECIRDIERYGVPDSGCSDTEDVITDFFFNLKHSLTPHRLVTGLFADMPICR